LHDFVIGATWIKTYHRLLIFSRLYSCLANGSAEEFQKGDHLYKNKSVKKALQIGKVEDLRTIEVHHQLFTFLSIDKSLN